MGRKPCCDKVGLKRGPWTIEEDHKLMNFILNNGIHCWRMVPKLAGLLRCGKSCRLRWINYLRPDLKRGEFTESEEDQIIELHSRLGNRWSKIASYFPGRTDNEIKNHWNTRIKKKMKLLGLDPVTHQPIEQVENAGDYDHDKSEAREGWNASVDKEQGGEIREENNDPTIMTGEFAVAEVHEGKNAAGALDQTADDCLLENYEVLCNGLDLESLLATEETKSSSSLIGNSSFSVDESYSTNSNPSISESSSLQENVSSFNHWIDSIDYPLASWDFGSFEDNLFHFGK